MGAIVMSIQRLLPVIQQAYFGWTKLSGAQDIIMDALNYLEEPNHKINLLPINKTNIFNFNRNIILEDINFSYGSKNILVLDKINLEIPRYSKIGITGPSGSGKSTLIDLIMGFLEPSSGKILVDGTKLDYLTNQKSWQANISLVPQNIYLSDTSIIHNIAFGLKESEIDIEKIKEVIKITQLEDFINSLDGKYNYVVGEDGKNLSHGQKQRIAIARALYRNSDLLVIDEGTSALDKKTQADVISGLNQLANRPAIIMVAHRIETLDNYDAIYELSEGALKKLENI
jgi:ATP-binding cassette, subfamily B, bacterial PglK